MFATAAALVGVGRYFGNEATACKGLEQEYFDSVALLRSNVLLKSATNSEELDRHIATLQDLDYKSAKIMRQEIYNLYADRAGQSAYRRGRLDI